MLKNYFIIAIRTLWRSKVFSLINIFGLSLGIAACLFLLEYIAFENSYDNFHSKRDRIYRVTTNYIRNHELIFDVADNFSGVGSALKKEIPEVMEYARLYNEGAKHKPVISFRDRNISKEFKEDKVFFADASFLQIFDFPLSKGARETALSAPNQVLISETKAKQYFGLENPIGKVLQLNNVRNEEHFCKVTGVFKDVPLNSHLQFHFLFSFPTLHTRQGVDGLSGVERFEQSWSGRDNFYTYILLAQGSNPEFIASKFPAIIDKYKPGYTEVDSTGNRIRSNTFNLQMLEDIHLYSQLLNEAELPGNPEANLLLVIIAVFTILLAWINYINLATAKSLDRAREVGIRKVIGGNKNQIILQFLIEALFLNLIAIFIALVFLELFRSIFYQIIEKNITFRIFQDTYWLLASSSFLIIGSFLSGLYPAFVLSSFVPVKILKGRFSGSTRGVAIRKSLVVFQLTISLILIAGTLAVFQQLQFMKNQDLGFDLEQKLVIEMPSRLDTSKAIKASHFKRIKEELLNNTNIHSVSQSYNVPGDLDELGLAVSRKKTSNMEEIKVIHFMYTDDTFIDTYRMHILEGESFSKDKLDTSSVIITESAMKALGFDNKSNAVGQDIYLFGRIKRKIKGIIQDYHQESLRKNRNPTLFLIRPEVSRYLTVSLNTENTQKTIEYIKGSFENILPGNPFEYFFLDDYFNRQYQSEQRFGKIITLFAALTVIVACLGLFGLSTFSFNQRTKEISIRKILGATITNILLLLSKEFLRLLIIASIIAIPLAYWGIDQWLQNYAYRTNIKWWILAIPLCFLSVVMLVTLSYKSIKLALSKPVDTLRYE